MNFRKSKNRLFIGVDPASLKGDEIGVTIGMQENGTFKVLYSYTLTPEDYAEIDQEFYVKPDAIDVTATPVDDKD